MKKKHVRTHLGLLNISVYKHSILTTDLKPFLGIKLIIDLINYYILLIWWLKSVAITILVTSNGSFQTGTPQSLKYCTFV